MRLGRFSGVLAYIATGVLLSGEAMADKRIAITFDDAPRGDSEVFTGAERATALLKALKDVDAPPVGFFVTTRGIEQHADGHARIERYAAAGHLIANHSHTHPWAHRTAVEDYLADIDRAAEGLEGFENRRAWFRFPFLDEGRRPEHIAGIAAGLEARGLANGYVTVDNYDWHVDSEMQKALAEGKAINYENLGKLYIQMMLYSAEYYDSIAQQMLGESPVHVLLLHENDLAALFIDDLILALRGAGWTIVSPDEAYDAPLPVPETRFTSQGRVFALAVDAGRDRRTMWTWAIDEHMIDLMLERSGAFASQEPAP